MSLWFYSATASGTTVSVPAGSLTLTGFAPQIPTVIAVPLGTLSLSAFAPQIPSTIAVPAGNLTLTGQAPTIPTTIAVPAGSLTLTGLVPTITAAITINVPAGALTLTGYPPLVQGNANIIDVPAGSLSLSAFAPTVVTTSGTTSSWPGWVGGSGGGGKSGVDLDELELFRKLEKKVAEGKSLSDALEEIDDPEVAPIEVPRKIAAKARKQPGNKEVIAWVQHRIANLEVQIADRIKRQKAEKDEEEEVLFLMQHLL